MQIPGTWSDFTAAGNCGFGIKTDGTIWSWGNNQGGPLGQNSPTPSWLSSPTLIGTDSSWSQIVGTAYAIKTDGSFWVWGSRAEGSAGLNLGHGTTRSSPTQIGASTKWLRMSSQSGNWMAAIREP